jgi:hypothetical protein
MKGIGKKASKKKNKKRTKRVEPVADISEVESSVEDQPREGGEEEEEEEEAEVAKVAVKATTRWMRFEDAREVAHTLGARGCKDYRVRRGACRIGGMPSNPDAYYKDKGWVSWGDFLGTGNRIGRTPNDMVPKPILIGVSPSPYLTAAHRGYRCSACGADCVGRSCGGCHAVIYCGGTCQRTDWRDHRFICGTGIKKKKKKSKKGTKIKKKIH